MCYFSLLLVLSNDFVWSVASVRLAGSRWRLSPQRGGRRRAVRCFILQPHPRLTTSSPRPHSSASSACRRQLIKLRAEETVEPSRVQLNFSLFVLFWSSACLQTDIIFQHIHRVVYPQSRTACSETSFWWRVCRRLSLSFSVDTVVVVVSLSLKLHWVVSAWQPDGLPAPSTLRLTQTHVADTSLDSLAV